jgi:ABC-type glycerol-3-phosphate transport system substrate-binding protein
MPWRCFLYKPMTRFKLPHYAGKLFFIAVSLLITGCQSDLADKRTTLQLAYWGSVEEVQLLAPLITRFEQRHPGVTVQHIHIPQQYVQKLHFMAASKLLPDVVMLNSWVLPSYAKAGLLQPAQGQTAYPQALTALGWQGQTWAYARDLSTLVVFANADLLKRHGLPLPHSQWRLSDLPRYAQRLKPHVWTISLQESPPLFWLPWVWAYGGQLWGSTADGSACLLPDSSVPGLTAFARLRQPDGSGYSLAPTAQQAGSTPVAQWFVQQKLAFLVSGRWTEPLLRKQARFQWAILPLPAGPAGSKPGVDATGYAVTAQTRHPRLAHALAKFLTSPDSQTRLSDSGLIVPAHPLVAQTLLGEASAYLQSVKAGVPTQSLPQWQAVAEQLGEGLQPVWQGRQTLPQVLPALRLQGRQLLGLPPSAQCNP